MQKETDRVKLENCIRVEIEILGYPTSREKAESLDALKMNLDEYIRDTYFVDLPWISEEITILSENLDKLINQLSSGVGSEKNLDEINKKMSDLGLGELASERPDEIINNLNEKKRILDEYLRAIDDWFKMGQQRIIQSYTAWFEECQNKHGELLKSLENQRESNKNFYKWFDKQMEKELYTSPWRPLDVKEKTIQFREKQHPLTEIDQYSSTKRKIDTIEYMQDTAVRESKIQTPKKSKTNKKQNTEEIEF